MSFIAYDKKGGKEYAKICHSSRVDGKVVKTYENLGRVIDKQANIFRNRKMGTFTYDPESKTYGRVDAAYMADGDDGRKAKHEQLILDFGDAYVLDTFLRAEGLGRCLDAIGYANPDTLYSMLLYYILCPLSNSHAVQWWEGSYARIMYPKASLASQRVSEFLADVGDEAAMRAFFASYIGWALEASQDLAGVLIDSTGLPNDVHFPLTAVSNHAGQVSNEVRLIYVTHQKTGLPLFLRYVPGNVVDVGTLRRTIAELKRVGVDTRFAILDAGYYSDGNARALLDAGVSFLSRLRTNLSLYTRLVDTYAGGLKSEENLVAYSGRYVYVKPAKVELPGGHAGYAYLCLDLQKQRCEEESILRRAQGRGDAPAQVHRQLEGLGMFALVSSRRVARDRILPLYYTRQQIEQIFDVGKNYASMLPVCVQKEDTFRGHLLMTFIASVLVKRLQDHLQKTSYDPKSALLCLRNQKCKIYDDEVITAEPFKAANDLYKILGIECPIEIPIARG